MNKYIYLLILQIAITTQCSLFKNGLPASAIILTAAGLATLHCELKIKCFDQKHTEFQNYFTQAQAIEIKEDTIEPIKSLATKIKHPIKGSIIDDSFIFFKLFDSDVDETIDEDFQNMSQEDLSSALQELFQNKNQLIDNQLIDNQLIDFYVFKKQTKFYRNINFVIALLSLTHLVYKIIK